ncbi:hypothetical protein MUY35_01105 [Aliiroseovarius sp. S1339]|uniref:hypothetical protein n=1 Tax=Aliiroseovarius sp. S1339 TaxID=2936990 RepID=UPI0020BE1F5F|nr:hypothetical protein [Aliiroseovarius sp. S1339]MCK8462444.1 hypothetical protein [Aliiroseovarius sp. S1339]
MFRSILTTVFALGLLGAPPITAQTVERVHGGDTFVAEPTVSQTFAAERNVFAVGNVITAKGSANGDVYLLGFDVDQGTTVGGDLLATGMTVALGAPIAGDVTATGFSVRNSGNAPIGGNAFLIGNTVTIDGPVSGALTGFGQNVVLNAQIDGDAWLVGEDISFGPDAVIAGQLVYSAEDQISVPERVISPDRVRFEKLQPPQVASRIREEWRDYPVFPAFMSMFALFLVSLAFFVALAAIFQTFLPKQLNRMQAAIQARPGQIFLLGVIGLSMLFGMVPIIALTVFGLPLVPIVLLAIVAVWTLGYALGAYAIAQRFLLAFGGKVEPTNLIRLVAFAGVLIVVAVLNFIPFLGWIANYALVLLGIGAMTGAVFNRILGNPGLALDVDMNPIDT